MPSVSHVEVRCPVAGVVIGPAVVGSWEGVALRAVGCDVDVWAQLFAHLAGAPDALTRNVKSVTAIDPQRLTQFNGLKRPLGMCTGTGEVFLYLSPERHRRVNGATLGSGSPTADDAVCDGDGEWWVDPELLNHELAHAAAGTCLGPPWALTAAWSKARRSDASASAQFTVGGVTAGSQWVSTYAAEAGEREDWADAVALFVRERRLGAPLIPAGLCDELGVGHGGDGIEFRAIWPSRHRIIDEFIRVRERYFPRA